MVIIVSKDILINLLRNAIAYSVESRVAKRVALMDCSRVVHLIHSNHTQHIIKQREV